MVKRMILWVGILTVFIGVLYAVSLDEAKFRLGERLFFKKLYREAIAEFTELLNDYPESYFYTSSLYYTARAYYSLANYEKAIFYYLAYNNDAKTDDAKQKSLYALADCYYKLKNYKEAAVLYKNFAVIYRNSPQAYVAVYFAAKSFENDGNLAEALAQYRVITLDYADSPYYDEALRKQGELEYRQSRKGKKERVKRDKYRYEDFEEEFPDDEFEFEIDDGSDYEDIKRRPLKDKEWRRNDRYDYRIQTNLLVITHVTNNVTITNVVDIPVTNRIVIKKTNQIDIQSVVTQMVTNLATNNVDLERAKEENRKKQDDLKKMQALVELKAKLLELKEKAVENQKDLVKEGD